VAQQGGNLVEVHQFTDPQAKWFFTRMEIDTHTLRADLPTLREAFQPLASELQADWTLRSAESRLRVS
jgi:formyltetrahydrofolate deformylase